jgi:hypothetical protein
MPKANPIAIAVFCVLGAVIITLALLPVFTKASNYVPPPKRGSWAPPFDPGNLPNIKPSNPQVCLPGTLGYNGLVTCTRQTDCKSCTDDNTLQCVTINNNNSQILDPSSKQLNPPVPVHLYRKGNGVCSGRGTQKSCDNPGAPDICKDYWCDCGSQYTHANNDPTNCDVQVLNVTQPGSYCLPSYVNACNPYTSETVLSNLGTGPQWTCECKYNNPQLFQQNAEGTNCDVPIACGSQEPQFVRDQVAKVMMYQGNGAQGSNCSDLPGGSSADWKLCDSYPNQLVSSSPSGVTPCAVPTVSTVVPIDKEYSYVQYDVAPLADPRCVVQPFTNTCTVQTGFDTNSDVVATEVMRGSGAAGDPKLSRLWPPFPDILPVGMQACPDNWKGSGTEADPCIDPDGKFSLGYLDKYGQWNGRYLALQDLRNQGYTGSSATTCSKDSDCTSPQICAGVGVCATPCTPDGTPCPEGTGCVGGVCSAINDVTCNPNVSTFAVGLPGTLGAIPWQTVNSKCSKVPDCLDSGTTLQQIKRSWTTPADLFALNSDNIGNSACSYNVQAPNCTCEVASKKQTCRPDNNTCGAGNVCLTTPVFPKPCSGTDASECGGTRTCVNGQCSVACQGDTDCNQTAGEFCSDKVCTVGLCSCGVDGSTYTCSSPAAGAVCSAATGSQSRPYDGSLDGPVVDENGNGLGGACSCQGFSLGAGGQKVPLIPGALLDPSLAWTCVPDPCVVPGSGASSYYDPIQKRCVCGADYSGATYYSWDSSNGVPTCQRDPCNPSGYTSPIQVSCSNDDQCSSAAVTCSNNKCYIWTGKACDSTADATPCAEGLYDPQSVQCLQGNDKKFYCAVEDHTRSNCSQASDCALGICNKSTNLCTGGCICSGETAPYFTDANPLHSACTNPCVFSPCGPNGTCQSDGTSYKCLCNPGYYGDSCELRQCLPPETFCSSDDQCCNNSCTYKFLLGHTCD